VLGRRRAWAEDGAMDIQLGTALVVVAIVSSVMLFLNRGDKVFPVIAVVAAGLAALIAFKVISLSVGKFRIDVILPALMAVSAGACWMRSSDKTIVTASTVLGCASMIMLLSALSILH
jgi:hypothetical protein